MAAVEATGQDFDDLKLYHLGPCRALPPYLLGPASWTKVLPPRFVAAREEALKRARGFEMQNGSYNNSHVGGFHDQAQPPTPFGSALSSPVMNGGPLGGAPSTGELS